MADESTQGSAVVGSIVENGQKPFPPELAGWNWGAFLLGWVWALGMSNIIGFILCFFVGGIGNIIVGIKGNEWAWQTRKFESVEQFRAVQKAWTKWGVGLLILGVLFGITMFVIVAVLLSASPDQINLE